MCNRMLQYNLKISTLDAFLSLPILLPFVQIIRLHVFLNSVIVSSIDSLLDLINSLAVNYVVLHHYPIQQLRLIHIRNSCDLP
jgi:hypothetical protein